MIILRSQKWKLAFRDASTYVKSFGPMWNHVTPPWNCWEDSLAKPFKGGLGARMPPQGISGGCTCIPYMCKIHLYMLWVPYNMYGIHVHVYRTCAKFSYTCCRYPRYLKLYMLAGDGKKSCSTKVILYKPSKNPPGLPTVVPVWGKKLRRIPFSNH